jgi:hypothetical protein
VGEPKQPNDQPSQGWFVNVIGWFSLLGLFTTGVIGMFGGVPTRGGPDLAGVAYLMVGGFAFWVVLMLVLRRGPMA